MPVFFEEKRERERESNHNTRRATFTFFFDSLRRFPFFLKKKILQSSDYFQFSQFSKEKTDALVVVCPTNTFCNYGTHINGDKLFAQTLMFVLRMLFVT